MSGQPPEPGQRSFGGGGVPIYNQPNNDGNYGMGVIPPNDSSNYGMGVIPPNNTPYGNEPQYHRPGLEQPQYHRPGLEQPQYNVPGLGVNIGGTVPEPGQRQFGDNNNDYYMPQPPSCGDGQE
ncbi:uncharacterized protein LOC113798388 isoform X2 [Dermatophagoides pteronyssinus]|uniref:Uncharacterized protein LOC113798388 isoform X3 n=1 Tax=Dermatophagoides pteronyssinus TaxID=6956 RepID=A0A6P6YGS9_DERPT|nr:uncharacterized protein LOC113798388 isoform X3 [Dermatophagoides pteronyssinus]